MTFEDFKKLIAYVESNNNQFAIRFEPHLYSKSKYNKKILDLIQAINECSLETAKVLYCCSFGKYQIMGFNLYSNVCNVNENIFIFCCDGRIQDKAFLQYLLHRYKNTQYVYFDLAKEIAKELDYAEQIAKEATSVSTFLEVVKTNADKFKNIAKFIRRYNGAIFPSDHALDYFLRMHYYYQKRIKKTEV